MEIFALRHQLLVLQRQVAKPAFTDTDRAVLAGLFHHLPPGGKPPHLLLPVRPDTILRRHRNPLTRSHAATCVQAPRAPAHRPLDPHPRAALGIEAAACPVWEILREHGIPPTPERQSTTRAAFPRSQADALPSCDPFETRTLTGVPVHLRRHQARHQARPAPGHHRVVDRAAGA